MTDRILDFTQEPVYLRVQHAQLVVERKEHDPVRTPLSEVAAIVLANPGITCTHAVLAGLMEHGAAVVVCDRRNLPTGMMLPIAGHSTQVERMVAQANATLPTRKRLWKQIVVRKIIAQAALLTRLHGGDRGLLELAKTVRSGDPANVEAQAARRYWRALFADPAFRRRRERDDQNRMLNYGYAVLRGIVGRAVCGAGLHPSLGLHHHNRYDAYCLVDDLMDPYRPIVDAAVAERWRAAGPIDQLDRQSKRAVLAALTARYRADGEVRTLFDVVGRTVSSLVNVFAKQAERLRFPEACERADA